MERRQNHDVEPEEVSGEGVLAGAGYAKSGRECCVCGSAGYGYDP